MDTVFHRTIHLDISFLSPLLDEFLVWGETALGDRKPFLNLALVIDELFMNSLHHGRHQGHGIEIESSIDRQGRFVELRYRDWGPAFDSSLAIHEKTKHAQPYLGIFDRPIGGVGLSLIGALVKDFSYTRDRETNLLVLRRPF